MATPEHVGTIGNVIGEGPLWNSENQTLYWVDFIEHQRIYQFTPSTGKVSFQETPFSVMALGLRKKGGFITATRQGLCNWEPASNRFDPLVNPIAEKPGIRLNDAAVDPQGRYWVGSMHDTDANQPVGELFRYDPDGKIHTMDKEITVSNGLGWSPDLKFMYFTDSLRYCIYRYEYEAATGSIRNRKVFIQTETTGGVPDGMTVDSEGHIWSAFWGGWRVVRYTPEGKVDQEYKFPVPNPTACKFGGKSLDELYVTTATLGLTADEKKASPQSGDLFRLKTGIKGTEEPRFLG
ncbi:MAG: SMP-30/gluconolactonase/LRE family protein [Acidobacteria bacterium]|nr:SMP-30/gluconolactonase/LRE family protein [Acidobacteriota bacterium]